VTIADLVAQARQRLPANLTADGRAALLKD
jgi:hypothetical protein